MLIDMRYNYKKIKIYLPLLLAGIILAGCEHTYQQSHQISRQIENCGFNPDSISINRLSEITLLDEYNNYAKIEAFINITDPFGVSMKYPGTIFFELYEFVPQTASNMGKLIHQWQFIDISRAIDNHLYWQDSLRSYKFELELYAKLLKKDKYILLATFTGKNIQTRLTDTQKIEYHGK